MAILRNVEEFRGIPSPGIPREFPGFPKKFQEFWCTKFGTAVYPSG